MLENAYWRNLVSNAIRKLRENHNIDAVNVIKNAKLKVALNNHSNLNMWIDYWDIIFELKYKEFSAIESRKSELETVLLETLETLHNDEYNPIANVLIQVTIEQFVDWQAVLPETKKSTINLIEKEHKLLEEIATGRSYKEEGVEEEFQCIHRCICSIAKGAGFEYPITCNSLAEWWQQIKNISGYADRRSYISHIYAPVITLLDDSEDISVVDFSRITSRSSTVRKAVQDAEVFIREGVCDSAVDRVHTAFHGYLEQVLVGHNESIGENEGLTAIYSKLHAYYAEVIRPNEVGNRIKTILRSASGIINTINELRNNNTIAHPNSKLIQEREARLVIRLVNAIVDYIEDIEQSLL